MNPKIKKWSLRISSLSILIVLLLIGIVLNPSLLYANKTKLLNYTIYHNKPIDKNFLKSLALSDALIKKSECFNSNIKLDICLNDGSVYPDLIGKLRGSAFAYGFYNKVVIMSNADYVNNVAELNGYQWNLAQLLAHEEIHCLQFDKFGIIKSNPIANYPDWKWEGYPEFIARQDKSQLSLINNIERKLKSDSTSWCITFNDNTISPKDYYNHWLLVQYCITVKKLSYTELLNDSSSTKKLYTEMLNWYSTNKKE